MARQNPSMHRDLFELYTRTCKSLSIKPRPEINAHFWHAADNKRQKELRQDWIGHPPKYQTTQKGRKIASAIDSWTLKNRDHSSLLDTPAVNDVLRSAIQNNSARAGSSQMAMVSFINSL